MNAALETLRIVHVVEEIGFHIQNGAQPRRTRQQAPAQAAAGR